MATKADKREQEKSSMLFRFAEAKKQELGLNQRKERPWDPWQVTSTKEAEKWRSQLVQKITELITRIVDERSSESQIRDQNDEINTQVREKEQWEIRIRELGGPDYRKAGVKTIDSQGREVPGNKGYKYYGRAKDLPGVKELFAVNDSEITIPKSRKEMYKHIDADYYGYRDEDSGGLVKYEKDREEQELASVLASIAQQSQNKMIIESESTQNAEASTSIMIPEYPLIPSQKQVEEWLVKRRKQALLDTYASK